MFDLVLPPFEVSWLRPCNCGQNKLCPILSLLGVLILFPIFTISILKWIIITNEIFETTALFEVNSKQSNILQFALTRGKRSKRQFHELLRWPIYIINSADETKLSFITWTSGPEKSHNSTREKIFLHVCWYTQSAADTLLAFCATRSGWWMNGKAFTILNTSCLSELPRIMAAKTLKNLYY